MGEKLKITVLGLLCLVYHVYAVMLSCEENDPSLLRKQVTISSEVGKDGKWVTFAHSYRFYRNETVKKTIKVDVDVKECGEMAVVFPKNEKQDPNATAGSESILIDRRESTNYEGNRNVDVVSSNYGGQTGVGGPCYYSPPIPVPYDWGNLRIYSRQQWGAKDLSHEMTSLYKTPPAEVIIGDTQSRTCSYFNECARILRNRQNRKGQGLFVNFMVGNGGMIFEGRGWDHHSGWRDRFIIDVIGSYRGTYPPETEMRAVRKLLKYGVKNRKIAKNYKMHMAKDIGWGQI